MAESGLTLGFVDLKQAIGKLIDYGTTVVNWTTAQSAEITSIVQTGVRRVYYPPVTGGAAAHRWSFLRPSTSIDTVADQWEYDLDSTFGSLFGKFHYEAGENRRPISIIPHAKLLDLRSRFDQTGYAEFASVRFKAQVDGSGQRQELLLYPTPDAVKTLYYDFEAYTGQLSDSNPYPLGGAELSELFKESCLAVAEIEVLEEIGIHQQLFQALLLDAIARDLKRGGRIYGQMGHRDREEFPFRRGYTGSSYDITYDGVTY